jgi:hypothetical protein
LSSWPRIILVATGLLVLAIVLVYRMSLDPWNSHGLGPGWECDATRGGASLCAKDVPLDWQKPRKPK